MTTYTLISPKKNTNRHTRDKMLKSKDKEKNPS